MTFKQKVDNEGLEGEARAYCLERIMARGLPMKLVSTEVTLTGAHHLLFCRGWQDRFQGACEGILRPKFKTRIEMRQIGVRTRRRLWVTGDMAEESCAAERSSPSFEPISIKMAKSRACPECHKLSVCVGDLCVSEL